MYIDHLKEWYSYECIIIMWEMMFHTIYWRYLTLIYIMTSILHGHHNLNEIKLVLAIRAAKIIFGPQSKRKLGPPTPILQIMIPKLSPPRCVISQEESVQQKWIDLMARTSFISFRLWWPCNSDDVRCVLDQHLNNNPWVDMSLFVSLPFIQNN
jgi:hypothetical protein